MLGGPANRLTVAVAIYTASKHKFSKFRIVPMILPVHASNRSITFSHKLVYLVIFRAVIANYHLVLLLCIEFIVGKKIECNE